MASNQCAPATAAENIAHGQCAALDFLLAPPRPSPSIGILGPACMATETTRVGVFGTELDGEFDLDAPVAAALLRQAPDLERDHMALLLASTLSAGELPNNEREADAALDRFLAAAKDATSGSGNLPGNLAGLADAGFRAYWRRLALEGFSSLASGAVTRVQLGPHVTLTAQNIGRKGQLYKGAKLRVRISKLPMNVLHALPQPLEIKGKGSFATARMGPKDLRRMAAAADAVADARLRSVRMLRGAGKVGGGVLAIGPSAAIDLYDSAKWEDGSLSVNWHGLAVRSAKSQSGNLVGLAAGAAAASGAVALGVVAAVGAPVVLVGLGVGIVAQIAWSYAGADEATAGAMERALR